MGKGGMMVEVTPIHISLYHIVNLYTLEDYYVWYNRSIR